MNDQEILKTLEEINEDLNRFDYYTPDSYDKL